MINSIKYFEENSIKVFEELETKFMQDPTKIAELVTDVTKEIHRLGLNIIKECLEDTDKLISESVIRKKRWYVEKHETKQLITSLGTVSFRKTMYVEKETKKDGIYLLDYVMGIEPHERLTEDAQARLLEEAVQTTYQKGGEAASLEDTVSKQTVKEKIHNLSFPKDSYSGEKKVVENLYIEADEDHISKQFNEVKGDLTESENGVKNNCLIGKMIIVHEGVEPENIVNKGQEDERKTKRWKLKSPHYFCRVCSGKGNDELWDEVYEYMDSHYDLKEVKNIYLNADGGGWIKSGAKRIVGVTMVLDEYHINKCMIKLTSHMKDSTDDARKEIYDAIKTGTKEEFIEITERLKKALENPELGEKRINESRDYIINNWSAIRRRLLHKGEIVGSSTEGHVYHTLSRRMSTQAMGWSEKGAANMCQLRAYYLNKGNMLELVRYQEKEMPKAAGCEKKKFLSLSKILASEKNRTNENGKYIEAISHSLATENKDKEWCKGILGSLIRDL